MANEIHIRNANQTRFVSDIEKSITFYRDVLGCHVDHWGHAIRDGMGFILQQAESSEDVHPNKANPLGDGYAYPRDLNELESLYRELKEKGASIVQEPVAEQMGDKIWKEFSVKDPDGYVIVFGAGDHE